MTSRQVGWVNGQSKGETHEVSGVLQRAAVRVVADKEGEATQEVESGRLRESRFVHDFTQVPIGGGGLPNIQAKLMIGAAGDKYEQEADRVAKDVVSRMNAPQSSTVQREEISELEEEELQKKPIVQRVSDVGGMAASPELEASIQGARGGGQPLADSVREPIEREFGEDFRGVRVHKDAQSDKLNQSIQAKAFTTGQDVFFRDGAYEPGSRAGQELLVHELTHVVQQHGSVQNEDNLGKVEESHLLYKSVSPIPMIQRRVGFEFETHVPVRKWNSDDRTWEELGYQEQIYRPTGQSWEIKADASHMEFVTDPINDRATFEATFNQILQFITAAKRILAKPGWRKLKQVWRQTDHALMYDIAKEYGNWGQAPRNWSDKVGDGKTWEFTGKPQATVGVLLGKIAVLMKLLNETRLRHYEDRLQQIDPNKVNDKARLEEERKKEQFIAGGDRRELILSGSANKARIWIRSNTRWNTESLEGLMALVLSYIEAGRLQKKEGKYAKSIFSLMARTDFHKLYELLPPREKKLFTVENVLNAGNYMEFRSNRIFAVGYGQGGAGKNMGPTYEEWIRSIITPQAASKKDQEQEEETGRNIYANSNFYKKKDLMSRSPITEDSSSMGAMDLDRLENGIDLAVLEIRSFPEIEQDYRDWKQTALIVFELMDVVNQTQESKPQIPKPNAPPQNQPNWIKVLWNTMYERSIRKFL